MARHSLYSYGHKLQIIEQSFSVVTQIVLVLTITTSCKPVCTQTLEALLITKRNEL